MTPTRLSSAAGRLPRPINFLAYGLNDVLGAGSMAVVSAWVLLFYTRFCGLSAVQAASIFAIARILDAIASPVIGHVSDHFGGTRLGKRFGRRRFFILAAIPLLPSFAFMWLSGQTYLYYLCSYIFFEMVYAMAIIPYETLAVEMSDSYVTRAKFAGMRIVCGQVALILSGYLPVLLIDALGRDSAATFFWMGAIFSVLFMGTAGFLYLFSWERSPTAEGAAATAVSIGAGIRKLYANLFSTLRVRAFRLHLGMYLGGYISQDIFNAAFTFFVIFALVGTTRLTSELLGVMYSAQLIAVFLALAVTVRRSPGYAYRIAAGAFAAGVVLLLGSWAAGLDGGNAAIWVAVALAGLGRGALNYIPWSTYNYMADVDQIVTGKRREGSFAGVMTFIRKATQAATVAAVGLIMEARGFRSSAPVQSAQAVQALAWLLGAGTLVSLTLGVLVSLRFRLDRTTHAVLMAEIEHLRGGAKEPSSPAARAIVEDLSGLEYARLMRGEC
jgi:oligogalacturonide transporter